MRAGSCARIAAVTGLVALATWVNCGPSLADRKQPPKPTSQAVTTDTITLAQSARGKKRHRRGRAAERSKTRKAEEKVVLDPIEAARAEAGRNACRILLAGKAIEVSEAPPHEFPPCVIAGPIRVLKIGSDNVEVKPAALVDCRMADALIDWIDKVVQPAAIEELGLPVKSISSASGFVCRPRNSQIGTPLSEHSFGKAIDISGFVLADGRRVTVLGDWYKEPPPDPKGNETANGTDKDQAGSKDKEDSKGKHASNKKQSATSKAEKARTRDGSSARGKSEKDNAKAAPAKTPSRKAEARRSEAKKADTKKTEPKMTDTKKADAKADTKVPAKADDPKSAEETAKPQPDQFLRKVHAGACGLFSTVLGPEANAFHRDHFHFDLRHRRGNDICE